MDSSTHSFPSVPGSPGYRSDSPQNLKPASQKRARQVARILCHIRDEVAQSHAPMPPRALIDALVFNVFRPDTDHQLDWQTLVLETLQRIETATATEPAAARLRGTDRQPLFPNRELFDALDVHQFCRRLLEHLHEQLDM